MSRKEKEAYLSGVQDAVAVIREHVPVATGGGLLLRRLETELGSLHPKARAERERTESQRLRSVVDEIAGLVVGAATADVEFANQRYDSNGNVCATVTFSPAKTQQWLRYAAGQGDEKAELILKYIACQRGPMFRQS